tara:strand:+ start:1703 stop:2530 length:828 start_codon:yes stop_codon:yes gene_type:complete
MVSTGISEFTFGYGFLYEQTQSNWNNLTAAPILPSLQKEKDEGWDAHLPLIGTDFYYQFKLSEYLYRGNAKFIKDGTYKKPYYRMSLHKRDHNHQHNTLVKHAKTHKNTFYVAPEFSGIRKFNRAFLSQQLMANSRLIPLNKCSAQNNVDQHYITFQPGSPNWKMHSELSSYDSSRRGDELESLYRESASNWREIDEGFAKEIFLSVSNRLEDGDLAPEIRSANEELLDIEQENKNRNGYLKRAAELLSVNFGISLVIVGSPKETQLNKQSEADA